MPVLWLVVICTSSTIASQAKIIIPLTKVPCVHWALPVDCAVVGVQYCNINALLSEIGFPAFLITPVSDGHAVSMCCHFWTCFDEVLKGLLTIVLHSASSFMQEWSNLATHIISDSQTPIPQGGMLNLWLLDPMTPRGLTSTSKESGVVLNLEWTSSWSSHSRCLIVKGKQNVEIFDWQDSKQPTYL